MKKAKIKKELPIKLKNDFGYDIDINRLTDEELEILKTREFTEDELNEIDCKIYLQDLFVWYKKNEPCAITSFGGVYLSEGLFLWADGSIEDEDYFIKL